VDGVAYESIIVHGLALLSGPYHVGELKNNSIHLGFSRDGFHVARSETREPFVVVDKTTTTKTTKTSSTKSNLQLASGSPVVRGGELLFYFGYGELDGWTLDRNATAPVHRGHRECTGLALLRRDGFAALEIAKREGSLITRPLAFTEERSALYVNVVLSSPNATLTVAILEAETASTRKKQQQDRRLGKKGRPRPRRLCLFEEVVLRGPLDDTAYRIPRRVPAELRGRRFRLRFRLTRSSSSEKARLFSFWFSSSPSSSVANANATATEKSPSPSFGFLGGGEVSTGRQVDIVT